MPTLSDVARQLDRRGTLTHERAAVLQLATAADRPERYKCAHDELAGAGVPALVVQGDRDPFGQPPRGRNRKVVLIPGAGHALKKDPAAVATAVITSETSLLARASV